MFQQFIPKLSQIERFDRVLNTKALEFGAVDGTDGQSRLALRLPTDEITVLEGHAQAQLAVQWGLPPAHICRLPIELAVAELKHFATHVPRDITLRMIRQSGHEHLTARAVLSGRYEAFDSRDVLEAVEPFLRGFEVSSAIVHRDEMRVLITLPGLDFDVSSRRVGDIVKGVLQITNSEIGTMSARAEISLLRLACSNGMCASDIQFTRVRHIHVDRAGFLARLRDTVARAAQVGEQVARRLERTHQLALPNLDVDGGKLQREVVSILRRANVWTDTFQKDAEKCDWVRSKAFELMKSRPVAQAVFDSLRNIQKTMEKALILIGELPKVIELQPDSRINTAKPLAIDPTTPADSGSGGGAEPFNGEKVEDDTAITLEPIHREARLP